MVRLQLQRMGYFISDAVRLRGLPSIFEGQLASSPVFCAKTLLLRVTLLWTALDSFTKLIAQNTRNWTLHRTVTYSARLIIWQQLRQKRDWNNWRNHLVSIGDLMDSGMILLYAIVCLQAICWEIQCTYFGPMEQWAQKLIFSWWLFKIDLAISVSWQMPCLGLALNLLAKVPKTYTSRNCWTTSFFKVPCTKVLHENAHLWCGWFGLQSKLCWLVKMFYKAKLQASQHVSNCAVQSATSHTPPQWLKTMHFCSLPK